MRWRLADTVILVKALSQDVRTENDKTELASLPNLQFPIWTKVGNNTTQAAHMDKVENSTTKHREKAVADTKRTGRMFQMSSKGDGKLNAHIILNHHDMYDTLTSWADGRNEDFVNGIDIVHVVLS